MEVVLYGAITGIAWLATSTVLLPFALLLKFSRSFNDKWFAFIFSEFIMPVLGSDSLPNRKRLFKLLKEHTENTESSIEILEIGVGSGSNLPFYPENSVLTALDVNESFEEYFYRNLKKHPQITYKKTIHGKAENMRDVADMSMDVVLSTYVFCSVGDMKMALAEVKRVLKKGGKFVFMEHVGFPKSHWGLTIQKLIAPLWRLYFSCYLHRDIGHEIENAGFSDLIMEKSFSRIMLYVRPHIMGVATK